MTVNSDLVITAEIQGENICRPHKSLCPFDSFLFFFSLNKPDVRSENRERVRE